MAMLWKGVNMDNLDNRSLLFYLSGNSTAAEKAAGEAKPFFEDGVKETDGVNGKAIEFGTRDILAWTAGRNIYAERGTLSFWWRSRFPLGPTAFPIFRVGYADHSSWDQCFMRIDYNGDGVEAYVTDINLSRARVWTDGFRFPEPDKWTHIAVSWDELWGLKLYVNGKEAASEYRPAVYDAGLYAFGPHSRIIGPWHVQTDYNFTRGGDLCELSIWDHMLSDDEIAVLGEAKLPDAKPYEFCFRDEATRKDYLLRSGMDQYVPRIPETAAARKVEIAEAFDLKRWWFKGMDGIRETTWPGVYNRSRLKGRNDYFQLPDWDCYSLSGKAITFNMPYEPYNHIEISGSAYGKVELVDDDASVKEELFTRRQGEERTVDTIANHIGGKVRFTNEEIEEPIGDFSVFNVYEGKAPAGEASVTYGFAPMTECADDKEKYLYNFIGERYQPYQRFTLKGTADGDTSAKVDCVEGLPFIHLVIPYTADNALGLDGLEFGFDTCEGKDAAYSIQIKDPNWYWRNLAWFTFRTEAGCKAAHQKLWIDTRDRILPEDRLLYVTIAVSDPESAAALASSIRIRVVYKKAELAKAEHIADRFNQVRDIAGHMTEESPMDERYPTYVRFKRDILDLLKVDPDHMPGLGYYYMMYHRRGMAYSDANGNKVPEYPLPDLLEKLPEGVPAWAARQVEYLRHYKKIIRFFMDKRQIANGELGGGLSDDGDFVASWARYAMMDCEGDKVVHSMEANERAFYDQGMFTNGLCSIQADELHSSEEGQVSLAACLAVHPGSPEWLEHAFEIGRQLEWLTGVNKAGNRLVKSCFYSGSVIAYDQPWGSQQSCCYISPAIAWYVAQYNGNPYLLRILREMADGLIAHYHPDEKYIHSYIRFEDDYEVPEISHRRSGERSLLAPAAVLLKEQKYWDLMPETDKGGMTERETGYPLHPVKAGTEDVIDKDIVAKRYEKLNVLAAVKEYYNTDGHPWIDRVYSEPCALYCDRLADPSDVQTRYSFPMNRITWRFTNWCDDERVAILTPVCEEDHLRIVVYNLSDRDVFADVIGQVVKPGLWEVVTGVDTNDDDRADENVERREVPFAYTERARVAFAAGKTTVVEMRLLKEDTPYWQRPDLGVGENDIQVFDHGINVRIHSLGAVSTPEVEVVLKNRDGKVLKSALLPSLEAPTDMLPRSREVIFYLHHITDLKGCYVEIDPENRLQEITKANNKVYLNLDTIGRKL